MPLPRSARVAFISSLLLAIGFGAWAVQALGAGPLPAFDRDVSLFFQDAAAGHNTRREIMVGFTHTGGVPAMTILMIAGVLWQLKRGDRILAAAWFATVLFGGLLDLALKKTCDRPRPPVEWRDEAVTETNESFPSGHSMGSLIGYGMLAYAALPRIRGRGMKVALLALLVVIVGLIGFSRIYLRAHWFSDVIGGFIIGAAWLSFGLAWVEWARRHAAKT